MSPTLRDYQQTAVDAIRDSIRAGARRPLLVAPTGAGKTVIFSHITANAIERGNRVTILVHRQELVDQTSRALQSYGVPHGLIAGGRTDNRAMHCQVASVQTLARRLARFDAPDLLIIDEAHHAAAGTWKRVVEHYADARILGVTATPERLDGKGLAGVFDDLIHGPQVAELIDRGFLARPKYWSKPAMNTEAMRVSMGDYAIGDLEVALTNAVMGDAVTEYRQKADGLPAIAFCPTIAKARAVSDAFREAGYAWDVIDGTLTPADRRELVAKLGDGRLHGLSACEIVSEGFDLPVVTAAILLRPTQSLALHLQQVGRVLRLHPTKTHAIILDHAGNLHRHGLAEDPREWSLDGRPKAKKGAPPPTKTCPECFCCVAPAVQICPECEHEFEVKESKLKHIDGSLVEFSRDDVQKKLKKARTLADFQEIEKEMGYKPGWAYHRFSARNSRPTYSYNL
jgi:DNA repair protein RadD